MLQSKRERIVLYPKYGRKVGTYNQIADENLQNLGTQAGAAREEPLQDPDQEVAQWRADERAVESHLGDPRVDVVAMLAAVARDPGGEDFLECGEGPRGQHAGSKGILLELGDIGLELWRLVSTRKLNRVSMPTAR